MNRSMPRSRRCVVTPMQKEWPRIGEGKWDDQAWQHLVRNQALHIGLQPLSRVLNTKRGRFFDKRAFISK